MSDPEPKHELRNGETIRAYLEELARLGTPVQLWAAASDEKPFETTLAHVTPVTFSSTTTPQLEPGRVLNLSFMLDARRFVAHVKVVASGVFRIPLAVAQGERRAEFRGGFERAEPAQVLAVEECCGTLLGGRTLLGKLLDLSPSGLRVALNEVGSLSGPGRELKTGDSFALVCLSGLPFTPTLQARGRLVHLARGAGEPYAGMALEGLAEGDVKAINRILGPRFPTTFGEAFPAKKRKTDVADQLGAPTQVKARVKAPEIVERAPAPPPEPAPASAVTRLRKAGKKILLLSENAASPAMAGALRADGFKNVVEAKSYLEAKAAAGQTRFDLLILDIRVGPHWGGDMMTTLRSHGLLLDTPLILLVDHRNDGAVAMAGSLQAVWIHERRKPLEELLVVAGTVLLGAS